MAKEELFETDDMGLAAFLSLTIQIREALWKTDGCYWVFPNEEGLSDKVASFHGGTALVDPKRYNTHFARLKKEMFQLKDGQASGGHGR